MNSSDPLPRVAVDNETIDLLDRLLAADWANRAPGADLRASTYATAANCPYLRNWLRESDVLADLLPGALRLRRRRRYGILRHINGVLRGLPIAEPHIDHYRTVSAPEPRVGILRDELDYQIIPGLVADGQWLPLHSELTFDDVRALTGMKAGTLYALTSRRVVPGQIFRALGNADTNVRELRFDARAVTAWAAVSSLSSHSNRR